MNFNWKPHPKQLEFLNDNSPRVLYEGGLPSKNYWRLLMSSLESTKGTDQYPYWLNEFREEFKGYEIWYCEGKLSECYADRADDYRVFMIYCNNNASASKSRLECVDDLKKATFENPIKIGDEYFWAEKSE